MKVRSVSVSREKHGLSSTLNEGKNGSCSDSRLRVRHVSTFSMGSSVVSRACTRGRPWSPGRSRSSSAVKPTVRWPVVPWSSASTKTYAYLEHRPMTTWRTTHPVTNRRYLRPSRHRVEQEPPVHSSGCTKVLVSLPLPSSRLPQGCGEKGEYGVPSGLLRRLVTGSGSPKIYYLPRDRVCHAGRGR